MYSLFFFFFFNFALGRNRTRDPRVPEPKRTPLGYILPWTCLAEQSFSKEGLILEIDTLSSFCLQSSHHRKFNFAKVGC
jgi:hypothetical protein